MKKISISLPSLFPDLLRDTIQSIYRAAHQQPFELEIVVVSPFQISGPKILWVEEKEPQGNSAAHANAYARSSGDYILATSDDHHFHPEALANALAYYQSREARFPAFSIGIHQGFSIGTLFGIYYPFFPFMSRSSIERAGGWYSRDFAAHFSDGDLGLRVWKNGGRCEVCLNSHIRSIPARAAAPEAPHRSSSRVSDHEKFISLWKELYGRGWNYGDIRDFNLDVPMALAQNLMLENSIYQNDPSFRDVVVSFYENIPDHNFLKWN